MPNKKYINNSLEDLFDNILIGWDSVPCTIQNIPMTHYILPTLIVQMSGFIEQKYDSILWEIGYTEYSKRHDIIGKYNCGSIDKDKYKKLYNSILLKYKKNHDNILSPEFHMDKCVLDKYTTAIERVLEKISKHSIYPELQFFTQYIIKVPKSGEEAFEILITTVDFRNNIAHFKDFYNISNYHTLFNQRDEQFNYINGISILIALDEVLTEAFKGYRTHHKLY